MPPTANACRGIINHPWTSCPSVLTHFQTSSRQHSFMQYYQLAPVWHFRQPKAVQVWGQFAGLCLRRASAGQEQEELWGEPEPELSTVGGRLEQDDRGGQWQSEISTGWSQEKVQYIENSSKKSFHWLFIKIWASLGSGSKAPGILVSWYNMKSLTEIFSA